MILRITSVNVMGPYRVAVTFNDGLHGTADLRPILEYSVFEPLQDPKQFAEIRLDSKCGTVVWPNGADLAPEAIRDLVIANCG